MPGRELGRFSDESIAALEHHHDFAVDFGSFLAQRVRTSQSFKHFKRQKTGYYLKILHDFAVFAVGNSTDL